MFENRPGQGALFKNRDRKNDRAPNLKGDALLQLETGELVEVEVAAWTKESEKAGRWLSLSVKPKTIRQRFDNANAGRQRFNQRVAEEGQDIDESFGAEPDDERF